MPRSKSASETPSKLQQNVALWGTFGKSSVLQVASWDPKQVEWVQAILEVVTTGATVVIRPGSGGGSVGIAIWEGNDRWPPRWCYMSEDIDEWAAEVLARVQVEGQKKKPE
jgi:hypothetical protein